MITRFIQPIIYSILSIIGKFNLKDKYSLAYYVYLNKYICSHNSIFSLSEEMRHLSCTII